MLDYFNEEVQKQHNIALRQDKQKENFWYIHECDADHNLIEPPKRVLKYIPLTESALELSQLYLKIQAANHPNLIREYGTEEKNGKVPKRAWLFHIRI